MDMFKVLAKAALFSYLGDRNRNKRISDNAMAFYVNIKFILSTVKKKSSCRYPWCPE
jgi:hypothetical protein